jgi:serine/threonine protein kinase
MPHSPQLTELLLRWEELRAQGREVTAEELCQACPEHVPEVTRRLEALQAVYHALETAPPPTTTPDLTRRELYDFLAPPQAEGEIGRLGHYRIFKVLGAGGMGLVFQAEDILLKRMVALKAMLPTLAASESARKRFVREAQTTASIDHEHIIPICQVGEDRGVPFLAMPLLQGETLEDRLKRETRLPIPDVLRIGREIAQGLGAAHARRLMHRDIKPANIWLESPVGESVPISGEPGASATGVLSAPEASATAPGAQPTSTTGGKVKILDFGLARVLGSKSSLTQQGAIIGTPSYMAPEQVEGKSVDERCDLFSLGCVLYALCTGASPFQRDDMVTSLLAVATYQHHPPSELQPDVPEVLSRLIMHLLAKSPGDRPSSASAVVETIRAIQEQKPAVELPLAAPKMPSSADKPVVQEKAWRKPARLFQWPSATPPVWLRMPPRLLLHLASKQLVVLFLLMVVLCGFALWWMFAVGDGHKPVQLVLIGEGYEENLAIPHNLYGMNGLDGVASVADDNEARFDVKRFAAADWEKALVNVKHNTVVLYLALHGGGDKNGPFLIRDGGAGGESTNLVRLNDVLDKLGSLNPAKKKLLILDATQPTNIPRFMVHNDFARQLEGLNDKIKGIDNLVVINSTGAYQRSWTSDEWAQTAFGHYLQEGLRGGADKRETGGNENGRISALNLFKFVQAKVKRWAHDNRREAQKPILLPRGEEGERRAENIELAVVEKTYEEPRVPKAREVPEDKLKEVWSDAEELLSAVPSPAVYSPQLLTRYLETLLRYEQFLRIGEDSAARRVKARLETYRKDMLAKRRLDLDSAPSALPMPAVLGLLDRPNLLAGADRLFDPIWQKGTKDRRREAWRSIQDSNIKDKLLKTRLAGWLLRRALLKPDLRDLPKACTILGEFVIPRDRPTEAHHMFMWQRDWEYLYHEGVPPAVFWRALLLRRAAEEVALGFPAQDLDTLARARNKRLPGIEFNKVFHPYSELVRPWIRAKVEEADRARRDAQDLLFSVPTDRQQAEELLNRAEDLYVEAPSIALTVSHALETRSRVMSLLPYYTRWSAQRADDDRDEQDLLQRLWTNTHELNALLETAPGEGAGADRVGELEKKARGVEDDFRKVVTRFDDRYKEYQRNVGELTQKDWKALDEALSVPILAGVENRLKLIRLAYRVSNQLNRDTKAHVSDVPETDATELEKQASNRAYRQARAEMAILGKDAFAKVRAGFKELEDVQRDVRAIRDTRWPEAANAVGEQTGLRWRDLPSRVNYLINFSRETGKLAAAAELMIRAVGLCRQIDGTGAGQLASDPVAEDRKLHTHDLLLWMAERTRQDRWFAENNQRYYKDIGLLYVRDAESLAGNPQNVQAYAERVTGVEAKRKQLREDASLTLAWSLRKAAPKDYNNRPGPAQVHITSEKQFDLYYRVQPHALTSGFPVVYVQPRGIKSDKPEQFEESQKPHAWSLSDAEAAPLFVGALENRNYKDLFDPKVDPSPTLEVDPKRFEVSGLFRGYRFRRPTDLYFHPRAHIIIAQNPLPDRAAFLVYASDELHSRIDPGKGAVAIVVDYSGSMNLEMRTGPKRKRIDVARDALAKMLRKLPANLEVSLWIFRGHKDDNDAKVDEVKHVARWKAGRDGDAKDFIITLNGEQPRGGTPLLEAMEQAAAQLKKVNKDKPRTMIVLTDGVPNDPKQAITSLRERLKKIFTESGISVHVIGFLSNEISDERPPQGDGEGAIACLKELRKGIQELPGRFYDAPDADKLSKALDYPFQWRFSLGDRHRSGAYYQVTRKGSLDNWVSVKPGAYEFWEHKLSEQPDAVKLQPGELRMYELRDDGRLSVGSFIDLFSINNQPWPAKRGWRLAARDNRLISRLGGQAQEILAMVENGHAKRGETPPPAQAWLELQDGRGQQVLGQRWQNRLGYPVSAAWVVRATRKQDRCRVQTWLRDTVVQFQAVSEHGRNLDEAFAGKQVLVEGVDVRIESVRVEAFNWVDEHGNRDPQRPLWCLVVRCNYPSGRPIWVKPDPDVNPARNGGYEHHYYQVQGSNRARYTGIFWFGSLSQQQVEEKLRQLKFYSVEDFKKDPDTIQLGYPFDKPPSHIRDVLEPILDPLKERK